MMNLALHVLCFVRLHRNGLGGYVAIACRELPMCRCAAALRGKGVQASEQLVRAQVSWELPVD